MEGKVIGEMKQRAACLILLLAFAGCTVGLNYKRPKVEIPGDYRAATAPKEQAPMVDVKWWELFKDPQLHVLIRASLDLNKDLRLAGQDRGAASSSAAGRHQDHGLVWAACGRRRVSRRIGLGLLQARSGAAPVPPAEPQPVAAN